MTSKLSWALALTLTLTLTACNDDDKPYVDQGPDPVVITRTMADSIWMEQLGQGTPTMTEAVVPSDTAQAYYDDYIQNWIMPDEEIRDIEITFTNDTVTWKYPDEKKQGTAKAVKMEAHGAHLIVRNENVTETGEADGRARVNYVLRGQSEHASIRIYSNKKFMITLDDAQLTNDKGSVINVQKSLEKKRVFICLKGNNYIADATQYSDTVVGEDDKGAIFSEGKMVITGNGVLKVKGNCGHAIASDDRIHIHGGAMVEIEEAAKDGLHAKEEIVVSGGWIRSFANKDAVEGASLYMLGGCLMAAGPSAVSAPIFDYADGRFCLVGNETGTPTSGRTTWKVEEKEGYKIATGK